LVSALYWPIVIYDKKLLVPDDTTFDLPLGLDITLHLMPAIVCWIDFLVFNTGFKKSPVHTLSIYTFTFFYYIWVKKCFEMNGWWAYPLLGMLTTLQRAFFFVFSAFFCSRIYSLSK
jgi:hypothetical protein